MLVGKVIGTVLKSLVFLFLFWLISSLIREMVVDYLDDYNVFTAEDTPAIVTEKVSVNNLTNTPKYYVIVDLNEEDRNGIKNRVFAWQFKRLEVGDTVKGHHIHGEHFLTTIDIVLDSVVFILVMMLMLFFLAALIMWPVIVFMERREKQKKPLPSNEKKQQNQRKKVIKPFLERVLPEKAYRFLEDFLFDKIVLIILSSIALVLAGGFLMNGLHKFSPIGKTKTTAFVTDSNAELEIYYYIGEYSDPYYTLDLVFEDRHGEEYRVIKEVTRSVYKKHEYGGPIEISYSTFNPYNVFVRDYSLWNLIEITRYAKFWFLSLTVMLFMTFLFIHFHSKKKKKG